MNRSNRRDESSRTQLPVSLWNKSSPRTVTSSIGTPPVK
jgi:hypothetical protein